MAKVDIVVPCYNYGRFLDACVRSILKQSVSNFRVLIIDDASSDNSLLVAKKLARDDSRVSVVAHQQNKGHISTYNEGIAWASSDYFLLLSADDLLVDGALERAVEIMDRNPSVVLTHGECVNWYDDFPIPTIELKQDYTWTSQDLLKEMCTTATNFVPTPTAIARTSTQKAIGGYRASLPHSGDMWTGLRFSRRAARWPTSMRYKQSIESTRLRCLTRTLPRSYLTIDRFSLRLTASLTNTVIASAPRVTCKA